MLRDGAGRAWRLAWSSAPGGRFALPAGSYAWLTYRLVEGTWHLSATAAPLATVEVRAGESATIDAKDGIQLRLRGALRPGRVQVEVHIGGAVGGGLSIYRDGRRVPLTCAIVDEAGGTVGGAPLSYG